MEVELHQDSGGEYFFNEGVADRCVSFFPRFIKHTKGRWVEEPFHLAEWQINDIIRPLFGWRRVGSVSKRFPHGLRRYHRCAVWIARKNGKTELAAGIYFLLVLGDKLREGECYSMATNNDQARIVFDRCAAMVKFSPELQQHFTPLDQSIYCEALDTGLIALSGKAKGKHGYFANLILGDEIHEWPDDRLYQYLHQSMAGADQPLEFLISTAGTKGTYGEEFYDYCVKVRDGIIDDPELLVVIYEPDEGDDWKDEASWIKPNPGLGVSPKLGFLRSELKKALESPRIENDFKRYHLNMWTEQAVRWINIERYDEGTKGTKDGKLWAELEDRLAGRECFAGLDLASTSDITALVLAFPPDDGDDLWHWLCRFWVPEETLSLRVRRDRVKYDEWHKAGALLTTPGNVTDYRVIQSQVYADAEKFMLRGLAIDRWNASQVSVELAEEGIPIERYGQGFASMSAPSKEIERLILSKNIEHGYHPVLRWMFQNVAIRTDPAGNVKPDKEKSSEKIDGVVAGVMGTGLAMSAEPAPGPSYMETTDMVFV